MTLHSNTSRARCRCVLLAVIIASMLMCAGDVELNPGPPKKAATLSSMWTRSNSQSQAETNDEQIAATAPTLTDVVEMLAGLMAKVDQINATIQTLVEKQETLKQENKELREKVASLETKVETLESVMDDMESRSRRNNLLFHGVAKTGNRETWAQSEELVKDLIKNQLGITRDIEIDRAHRVGVGANSPIIARFAFFKDREVILGKKKLLKGTNFFIGEDFTRRVREVRKKLLPYLRKVREEGKQASMVFDHLVVDGRRFNFDEATGDIKRVGQP